MSKSGFFNNSGTSSTVENTIQGSVDAAAASATAAASSETDAQTAQAASEAARDASQTAQTASETAKTASEAARDAAQVSQNAAAASASTATTQAALATTNGAAQVTLATAQVALATTEANDSATSAAAALTSQNAAAASASTASSQATLATSNGAAQVALATTQANNAASSATAAANSQTAAANSAAAAATTYDNFDDRYHGALSSNPTADPDGNALAEGMLYFNSSANEMRVYDGSSWIAASSAGTASLLIYKYTATAGQTSFSGADDASNALSYTVDNIIVTLNGVVLEVGTDVTATNGTAVVLASGAAANDELNVYAFKSFTTADMVSKTNGGAFVGNVDFGAGVDVTGNITVTGTVDGRDVAADGTKLDGIEASATADQTAAEIRTLVESATDSNVFTDADHTKLNAIEASADVTDTANVVAALTAGTGISIAGNGTIANTASTDLVSDSSPQLGGALDVNGNSITSASNGDVTIDPNGTGDIVLDANVGIGTASPTSASGGKVLAVETTADEHTNLVFNTANTGRNGIIEGRRTGRSGSERFAQINIQNNSDNGELRFYTAPSGSDVSERARFDSSGRLLISTSSLIGGDGALLQSDGGSNLAFGFNINYDGLLGRFYRSNSIVGSISVTTSGTTYNTTSDIRLKQDIEPLAATDKLMAMNPVSYAWKADPDGPRSMGFIAQEMQEVMPEAVSGTPDGEDMMSMDYGRITPILVSALQDAHRKIEQLEQRLADMEAK